MINKKEMYYIVEKGTNVRILNPTKDPRILNEETKNRILARWSDKENYEGITISDYEDKFQRGESMNNKELMQKLESLPAEIRTKSLELLDIQAQIDIFSDQVSTLKVSAMEKVLTDGLATNDKARVTAQTGILSKDQLYIDADKSLREQQKKLKYEQAQLELLHNQFRAYLAIAGMISNPAVY
jgi:hypothetical protein